VDDESLRQQLADLLAGNGAHMTFDDAVDDFPDEAINGRPPNVEYTPWHLLEHLRLTQADILDYVTNEGYVEPSWPADYWPAHDAIATRAMFDETIRAFRADLASLRALSWIGAATCSPSSRDAGHTLLREARIDADHNAYHVGESPFFAR
jgi:hypothetical protein